MVGSLASNTLYRQYEEEKSLLELYGHASSLTYEEWLEAKRQNNVKESINYWMSRCSSLQQEVDALNEKLANASVIHWQTGEPPTNGVFLVVYKGYVCAFERKREFWMFHGKIISDKDTTAWCKLSTIQPYKGKEETK